MTGGGPITLAIETSNPSGCGLVAGSVPGVALARGRTILGIEAMDPAARHDDDLMPAIDRLVRRCGNRPMEIARIAVSTGPGGFTGLRVAVVTAKLIATASGGMCVGVPAALALVRRLPADLRGEGPVGVVLASKGERAHASVVEAHQDGRAAVRLAGMLDAAGFAALGARVWIVDAHVPKSIRDALVSTGAALTPAHYDPAACAEASFDLPGAEPDALQPIYAREPEAVTLWRERHGTVGQGARP